MPNYEEIIEQSQANVKSLNDKLKDLDKLYQDISTIEAKSKEIPLAFEQSFQKISELSKQYTETLGKSSKIYLEGNNTLFTNKLKELSDQNTQLENEISRLVNTDLNKLFSDLQVTFIEQTKKDLENELIKFDQKATNLQTKIDNFSTEINRLENVNLELHFDNLQKTLSDIFEAINAVNLNLTGVTSSLNSVIITLGQIEKITNDNFKETNTLIANFNKGIENQLTQQNIKNEAEFEILKNNILSVSAQNSDLMKEIKTSRKIQVVGLVIIIAFFIYLILRS